MSQFSRGGADPKTEGLRGDSPVSPSRRSAHIVSWHEPVVLDCSAFRPVLCRHPLRPHARCEQGHQTVTTSNNRRRMLIRDEGRASRNLSSGIGRALDFSSGSRAQGQQRRTLTPADTDAIHEPPFCRTGRRFGENPRVRGPNRPRRVDRAEGLDAGAVPPAARAHDVSARALPGGRDAARGQLYHPRAESAGKWLCAAVQDGGAGLYIYCGTETLGVDRER